jgi:hypothetical protein
MTNVDSVSTKCSVKYCTSLKKKWCVHLSHEIFFKEKKSLFDEATTEEIYFDEETTVETFFGEETTAETSSN